MGTRAAPVHGFSHRRITDMGAALRSLKPLLDTPVPPPRGNHTQTRRGKALQSHGNEGAAEVTRGQIFYLSTQRASYGEAKQPMMCIRIGTIALTAPLPHSYAAGKRAYARHTTRSHFHGGSPANA